MEEVEVEVMVNAEHVDGSEAVQGQTAEAEAEAVAAARLPNRLEQAPRHVRQRERRVQHQLNGHHAAERVGARPRRRRHGDHTVVHRGRDRHRGARAPEDLVGRRVEREPARGRQARLADRQHIGRHAVEAQLEHQLELRRITRLARLHEPPGLPQLVPLRPATVTSEGLSHRRYGWWWRSDGGKVGALRQVGWAWHRLVRHESESPKGHTKDCSKRRQDLSLSRLAHCKDRDRSAVQSGLGCTHMLLKARPGEADSERCEARAAAHIYIFCTLPCPLDAERERGSGE